MPVISKAPSAGEPAAAAAEAASVEPVASSPPAAKETAPAVAPDAGATPATESGAAGDKETPAAEASPPSTTAASEPASVETVTVEAAPAGGEGEDAAVAEAPEQQQPTAQSAAVPPGACLVHPLPRDPLAVDAEYLGGPGFGQQTDKLKALATPPLEFCATLADNFRAEESITVQGPLGPITVEPPAEAEAGMSLRYQLVPRPDFKVQVPPNTQSGTEVRFDRGDGVEISVMVPESLQGDVFEVTPPALMVKVPEGGAPGVQIAFRSCSELEETAEWFGLTLPEGCQPGKYVTAKLPHPKKIGGLKALKSQAWEWQAQAMKEIKGGSIQLLKQFQRTTFDRAPLGDLLGKGNVANPTAS